MAPFLISTGIITLAEIGDKTQLLAFLFAVRFRKPLPILLGILVATIANHSFAGALGTWISSLLAPEAMRWILGFSFIGMAIWTFTPDEYGEGRANLTRYGVFATTLIAFFLAEMGDKTQVATVAMAARYQAFHAVVAGTTLGMMIANLPAVLLAERIAIRIPVRWVRGAAAAMFAILGAVILLGAGGSSGP
jgi:putative Ca2+/H+ antiporter (TMEM165/GDT1 family)